MPLPQVIVGKDAIFATPAMSALIRRRSLYGALSCTLPVSLQHSASDLPRMSPSTGHGMLTLPDLSGWVQLAARHVGLCSQAGSS